MGTGVAVAVAIDGEHLAEICRVHAIEATDGSLGGPSSRRSTRAPRAVLASFSSGFLSTVDVEVADLERAAELVETYADLPLGGTDACVVALAERLGVAEVVTLDRRHFSVVRPRHVDAFTIVPAGRP